MGYNKSKITPVTVKFKYAAQQLEYTNINDIEKMKNGAKINIAITVIKENEISVVAGLHKQDKFVADRTGVIRMDMWQEKLKLLKTNMSYIIEGVFVKSWQEKNCLSLAKDSNIQQIDHLDIPKEITTSLVDDEEKLQVRVHSVCITKHLQCTKCNALWDDPTDNLEMPGAFLTCTCKTMQLRNQMQIVFRGNAEVDCQDIQMDTINAILTKTALLNFIRTIVQQEFQIDDIANPLQMKPEEIQAIILTEEHFLAFYYSILLFFCYVEE